MKKPKDRTNQIRYPFIYWELAREITVYIMIIGMMCLFGYAGIDKLTSFTKFRSGLENSPLIPDFLATGVAVVVALAMLAVSICLLVGFWKSAWTERGLWFFLGIMALFTAYIGIILLHPETEPCVCIGLNENWGLSWKEHVWLNIMILLIAWQATLLYYLKIFVATDEAPSQPQKTGNT